jgi:hypothetical protein
LEPWLHLPVLAENSSSSSGRQENIAIASEKNKSKRQKAAQNEALLLGAHSAFQKSLSFHPSSPFCYLFSTQIIHHFSHRKILLYTNGFSFHTLKRQPLSQSLVAHAYNLSYSGGRDQEDCSSAQGK